MDETVSMVDFLHNSCRFFAHESCGQCTPCREGTNWALRMLERIKAGKGRLKDLDLLLEIGDSIGIMPGTTICGLADGAAWPIKNAIRKFRGEFEDYIKRTNPTGYMVTEAVPALIGIHATVALDLIGTANTENDHGHRHRRRTTKSKSATASASTAFRRRERAGVEIPHYCWHPGLSVVASCRMCLVETGTRNAETGAITMLPKLVPACQTPAKDGTVFVTNSEKVKQSPGDGRRRLCCSIIRSIARSATRPASAICRIITSSTARPSAGPTSSRSPAAGATWATRSRCSSIAA